MKRIQRYPKGLDRLQKVSVSIMAFLVVLTFVGANLHALLWQQSTWLVSTVLPAVVVDLTNAEREDLQASELRRNTTLDEAAQLKAEHMAANEYFSHYSPEGVSPWYWFSEAGYVYAHAGENLAIHFTDSSEVVEAWMNSPAHRANIVNSNYTEIGVGTAKGTYEGYDTVYVVQLFGAPAIGQPASVVAEPEEVPTTPTSGELDELARSANEIAELVASLTDSAETADEVPVAPVATEEAEPLPVRQEPVVDTTSQEPEEPVTVTESNLEIATPTEPADVLVVESTISTSSGLTIASVSQPPNNNQAGTTMVSMVTQPNQLLQLVYLVLGMVVMALLLFSAVFEARQLHFVQVTYSFALMVSMGALWYVHSLLTSGAVIA